MGAACSGPNPEDAQEKARSRDLEKEIQNAHKEEESIHKLLLLGAGESGKSTLFKQMIQIYGKGFPEEERKNYRPIVCQNVVQCILTLCDQLNEHKTSTSLSSKATAALEFVRENSTSVEEMNSEMAAHIKRVWAQPCIKEVYELRSNFQLPDSAAYFLDKVDEMGAEDYVPSQQDVLRSRVRTTGIVENEFIIDESRFKMYDVGGQRNERKKWIHCFEGVTAVIFVAAISEYDQVLYEHEGTNRLQEALELFGSICNSRWFQDTSIILFLNKADLFKDKLKKVPLKKFFDEFDSGADFKAGCEFMEEQFLGMNKNPKKQIYVHVTTATDTDTMEKVFGAVKDIVIKDSLRKAGLLDD